MGRSKRVRAMRKVLKQQGAPKPKGCPVWIMFLMIASGVFAALVGVIKVWRELPDR